MPQHNTHIANASGVTVKVVLTDNGNRNTTKVLDHKQHVCIPTPHGRISVDVFRQIGSQFQPRSDSNYSDDSDRSFIIKMNGSSLDVVRAKYGKIWEEDSRLR